MKKGFTLVELLIVIIIIGILATMAIPQYNKMVGRAKRTEAISNLSSIGTVSLLYYTQNGTIPSALDTTDLDITTSSTKWSFAKGTHTTTSYLWVATNSATSSWKVRETVVMPSGTKTFEEDTGAGYLSITP